MGTGHAPIRLVRLHQPSAHDGVNSLKLETLIEQQGGVESRGLHELVVEVIMFVPTSTA